MACRIHHVAYVENLYPRRHSNLSTAFIRPILPSWIRSRNCRPRLVYFLAIEMTSRRLASTISFLARLASRSPRCTVCTTRRNSEIGNLASIATWATAVRCFSTSSFRSPSRLQPMAGQLVAHIVLEKIRTPDAGIFRHAQQPSLLGHEAAVQVV